MNSAIPDAESVDQLEIEKFNKLASTWWDANGPMWPLHRLNKLRESYIVEQVAKHFERTPGDKKCLQGLRFLDIGCGGGLLSESMAAYGAEVHGVDISDGNIATAKMHATALANPPVYELTTAEALNERGERYDVVLNMEVVEHVANLSAFMNCCSTMVKPDGLQFISTINRNIVSWFSAIIAAEYILKWLPKGTHQYNKLVKPQELDELLLRDNMSTITATGVFVNPITRAMSLSKLQLINFMVVAKKNG